MIYVQSFGHINFMLSFAFEDISAPLSGSNNVIDWLSLHGITLSKAMRDQMTCGFTETHACFSSVIIMRPSIDPTNLQVSLAGYINLYD